MADVARSADELEDRAAQIYLDTVQIVRTHMPTEHVEPVIRGFTLYGALLYCRGAAAGSGEPV